MKFFINSKPKQTPTQTCSVIQSSFISEEDESTLVHSPSSSRMADNNMPTSHYHQLHLPIIESVSCATIATNTPIAKSERRFTRSGTSKKGAHHNQLKTAAAMAVVAHHYAKNKKAFRILCLVTCSLIIFWMPWIVSWPVQAYCNCLPRFFYTLTYWLEYLNSLINSVILIVFNQHFRKKFLLVFFNFK